MRTTLDDAFAHHVWATLRVLDTCVGLSPEQRETTVPGTYGSIMGPSVTSSGPMPPTCGS